MVLSSLASFSDPKTWSTECRSPDRMWIASAFIGALQVRQCRLRLASRTESVYGGLVLLQEICARRDQVAAIPVGELGAAPITRPK
jgi:hypothetical protein